MNKHTTTTSSSSSTPFQRQDRIEEDIITTTTNKSFNSFGIPLKSNIIQVNREHEKRELSQLNDRFASYIERVRFLEAHNKKLQLEINDLRGKWGLQTNKLKEKYDVEIQQARHTIDNTSKDCIAFNLRTKRAEEEKFKLQEKYELILAGRESNRSKIELLEQQLINNEADINLFHRRLIDLKDEQQRYNTKSTQLISDIQRITKDLDHETLTRIELENKKQSLEEEMHFLKEIHAEEVEELKQSHFSGTTLDSTRFFQNQLADAVRNIRKDYEEINQQQKTELYSWYQSKVTQAIQEIRAHPSIEKPMNIRDKEEINKLQTVITNFQQESVVIREKNGELEYRIRELEKLIENERNNNLQASNQRDEKLNNLRIRLEDLGRNYDELITTKSSLDSEIAIYRKLLEGEEKSNGLRQIAENVEQQARMHSSIIDDSATYSRSYQRTTSNQESSTDDNTRNKNARIPSLVYQQPIRLRRRSDSSDRSTDYDSSIEDPNERLLLLFHKKN